MILKNIQKYKLFLLGFSVSALLIVGALSTMSTVDSKSESGPQIIQSTPGIDLVSQDWSYMPGVTKTNSGLHVAQTDFRIVEQDGSGGQPNPPLNLYGTHLQTGGEFQVYIDMKNVHASCSVQLYDSPPIIADEFRIEPSSIKLTETAQGLEIQAWNGQGATSLANQQPLYSQILPLSTGAIELAQTGSAITVTVGTSSVQLPHDVLSSGAIWLGLDSSGSCDIPAFTAQGAITAVDATNNTYSKSGDGLATLATKQRPDFKVGAAVALGPIVSDKTYANELTNNFNSITPENLMKWQNIEPEPGQFSFEQPDALVNFAQKNGMVVHGHTLLFSEANPKWVQNLPTATAADKQQAQATMLNHITTIVSHYKGKVASWDVVDEPLQDYDTLDPSSGQILRNNVWFQAMGSNYIALAYQAAHQADPSAKLFINDYGLEADGERWDTFYNVVKQWKAEGVPIDGVGFESHVYDSGDIIDPAILKSHIDQLAKIGLVSRISEMDVYDDDGLPIQTQQYSSVFNMCLDDSNCVGFTTWGVDDRYDVFQDDDSSLQFGTDLLFNQGQPTPAYQAIEAELKK